MKNKETRKHIKEGYGAGYSYTGGSFRGGLGGTTRGGFGGANNLGGPNMMYTYEVKPLNHTLEQLPVVNNIDQSPSIQLGSKISGYVVKSNAVPDKKKVKGILHKIVKTDNGAVKYYIVIDQDTQELVKVEPLGAKLLFYEPIRYVYDTTDTIRSRRKEKLRKHANESLMESLEVKNEGIKDGKLEISIGGHKYFYTSNSDLSIEDISKKFNGIAKYSPGRAIAWLKRNTKLISGSKKFVAESLLEYEQVRFGQSQPKESKFKPIKFKELPNKQLNFNSPYYQYGEPIKSVSNHIIASKWVNIVNILTKACETFDLKLEIQNVERGVFQQKVYYEVKGTYSNLNNLEYFIRKNFK